MGQEFQVPATFTNKQMSPAFMAALGGQQDSLADGIGQSYGVIGYKGKVWSLRYRGQRHNILRPDDGTPASYLDVIILNKAPTKSKSYYPKYEPGSSDGERPICASIDGIHPDPDVQTKQCESCAICPRNVFKQDPQTGRKSRECTDYMRLAVLILPPQTKPLFGTPLLEPVFLRVPPASLNSLAIMGDTMDRQGFHYASYVTRITFDPNKSWPEMVFRPIQQLTDAELPVVLKMRDDPVSARITGGDFTLPTTSQQALPTTGVATGLASLPGPSAPAPAIHSPAVQPQPAAPTSMATAGSPTISSSPTPTVVAPPATPPAQTEVAQSTTPPVTDTGLGGALNAVAPPPSEPQQNASSVTSTVSSQPAQMGDAGEADESDAEMDARIAALIKA
jgi:hypothetical protein